MKPAPFDYIRVSGLEGACEALQEAGPEARILAGGQTLVPMLAMRLARPSLLVDINEATDLKGIEDQGNAIVIRSGTRQKAVAEWGQIASALPILSDALQFVGHIQTRNRGTIGGSIVHADPSAEIGLIAVLLDATIELNRVGSSRRVSVDDFITGPMETDIRADECATEIRFPVWPKSGRGHGFEEVSVRRSDFAIVAAAVQIAVDPDHRVQRIAAAVANCGPKPVRLRKLESAFTNELIGEHNLGDALDLIDDAIDPASDMHASAGLRRRIARTLVGRAIERANACAIASIEGTLQ